MKNLKRSFVALFGLAVLFTACNQENVDPFDFDAGDQAVLDMVFLATGEDSPTPDTDHKKGKCKMTEVAEADLPASITAYITTNYAGGSIKRAGTNTETGEFGVLVLKADGTHVGVKFAADGSFIAEHMKMNKKGSNIEVSDLPEAITSYISSTYPNSTIKGARQSDEGKFGVVIQLQDESHKGLAFDAAGAFLGELTMKKRGKRGKH